MRKTLLIVALVFAAFVAPTTLRADITYTVDDTVGTGTVTGFIETDGTIGTLGNADILNWDLVLTDSTGSADLLGPLSGDNSSVSITSSNVTASATALQFDFNGNGGLMNFFDTALCSPPEWSFETTGSGEACNGTTGNEEGIASNDGPTSGTYSAESGEVTFATATSAVPEPGTFGLMLIGLGSLGLWMVMRKRVARGLPQAT